jgi:hypothetical protein
MTSKIDLITIENDKFSLNIKGKPIHPESQKLFPERNKNQARIKYSSSYLAELTFKYYRPENGLQNAESNSIDTYPLFFEYQDYDIYIEAETDIEFYHPNQEIRESLSHPNNKSHLLYGSINFKSDIGYSEFEIRSKTNTLLTLNLEVFPSKIDYQSDYNNLINEVNQEVYNLAYDFLRKTYQNMKIAEEKNVSEAEFFVIIENIFKDLLQAFTRIENSPHHRIVSQKTVKPASKVKKINRASLKWLNKNNQYYDRELDLPKKILSVEKELSFNTFENKFLKWVFTELIKRLKHFKDNYLNYKMNPDPKLISKIENMIRKLNLRLKHSFLEEVGKLQKIDSISLVLQMAPGYKEIYKYYLMLLKGLSLEGEIFRLSIKELWQLYEYWTFLKLNRILKDKYKMIKNDIIELDYSGINVTLSKGSQAEVEYLNPITGEIFTLSYNAQSGDGITTNQKPDNILSLSKKDSEYNYKFIFDAKYRLNMADPDTKYGKRYKGIPGPEEDDINRMHRYRDAVAAEMDNKYQRTMVGAYVLFPYHDQEKFKDHKFSQSIKEVNIGAFPFLPGSTELLANFLEEVIEESALSNFSRNLMPAGTEEFRPAPKFKVDLIVGSLRNKKQFEFIKDNKIYYLPLPKNQHILNYDLEYAAVFQSENKFGEDSGIKYYGKIREINIVKRKEIDFPMSKNNPDEDYIVLKIERWQQLGKRIKAEGYGISGSHIYSNYMLLKKADTLPELSIRSLNEWRLWLELKRLKQEIKVEIKENNLDKIKSIEGFRVGNLEVIVDKDYLTAASDNEIIEFSYREFLKNPRKILNEIMELIDI